MRCTLMHKRIEVAQIELDDASAFIQKIYSVSEPSHLPLGIKVNKGVCDRKAMNDWWTDRSIPASRSGVREALEALNVDSTRQLLMRCYGLSLSDQYWIKPTDSSLCWDDINFFDNSFSDDMGDVLFGNTPKTSEFDFSSPDNTSDGCLKKRWKIIDGKRYLIKGGSNPFRQQPFNEVIASDIMERLEISHVPYSVIFSDGDPYSVCEDFITVDTELVSAWRIMQTSKRDNNTSVYRHFVNCCEALGAPDVVPSLDRMIVLDFIIANEDRHLNNFGLVRNAESLEGLGMAPIFDSGSSLGYDKLAPLIRSGRDITCKPFKNHHTEQLKLVSSFDWIDFDNLRDVKEMILDILCCDKAIALVDKARAIAIAESVEKRIQTLKEYASDKVSSSPDLTDDDVKQDIAEDYTNN